MLKKSQDSDALQNVLRNLNRILLQYLSTKRIEYTLCVLSDVSNTSNLMTPVIRVLRA